MTYDLLILYLVTIQHLLYYYNIIDVFMFLNL